MNDIQIKVLQEAGKSPNIFSSSKFSQALDLAVEQLSNITHKPTTERKE